MNEKISADCCSVAQFRSSIHVEKSCMNAQNVFAKRGFHAEMQRKNKSLFNWILAPAPDSDTSCRIVNSHTGFAYFDILKIGPLSAIRALQGNPQRFVVLNTSAAELSSLISHHSNGKTSVATRTPFLECDTATVISPVFKSIPTIRV